MKRGDRFIHKHWLDENNKPLECVVTRVARGTVYWRPVGGGSPMCFSLESSEKYVGSMLGVATDVSVGTTSSQARSENEQ
jgi:hypothetical protein